MKWFHFQLSLLFTLKENWFPLSFLFSIQLPISHLFSGCLVFWDQSSILISLSPIVFLDFWICSSVIFQESKRLNWEIYISGGRKEKRKNKLGYWKVWLHRVPGLGSLNDGTLFWFWYHQRTYYLKTFNGPSDRREVVAHCRFDVYFSHSNVEHRSVCLWAIWKNHIFIERVPGVFVPLGWTEGPIQFVQRHRGPGTYLHRIILKRQCRWGQDVGLGSTLSSKVSSNFKVDIKKAESEGQSKFFSERKELPSRILKYTCWVHFIQKKHKSTILWDFESSYFL